MSLASLLFFDDHIRPGRRLESRAFRHAQLEHVRQNLRDRLIHHRRNLAAYTLAIDGKKRGGSARQVAVLRRTAERWQHEATVPVPTSFAGRSFDTIITTLALSGEHLAIGAVPFVLGSGRRGGVHVYGRVGTVWTQEATLAGPHPAAENMFGRSVSLFRDTLNPAKLHGLRRLGRPGPHLDELAGRLQSSCHGANRAASRRSASNSNGPPPSNHPAGEE